MVVAGAVDGGGDEARGVRDPVVGDGHVHVEELHSGDRDAAADRHRRQARGVVLQAGQQDPGGLPGEAGPGGRAEPEGVDRGVEAVPAEEPGDLDGPDVR